MTLFSEIEPPKKRLVLPLRQAKWFTWSDLFIQQVQQLKPELRQLKTQLVHFNNNADYNYTYDVKRSGVRSDVIELFSQ